MAQRERVFSSWIRLGNAFFFFLDTPYTPGYDPTLPRMLSCFGIKEEQTGHRGKKKRKKERNRKTCLVICMIVDESNDLEVTPLIF